MAHPPSGNNTSSSEKLSRKNKKVIRRGAAGVKACETRFRANNLTLSNFVLVSASAVADVEGDGAEEGLNDDRTGSESIVVMAGIPEKAVEEARSMSEVVGETEPPELSLCPSIVLLAVAEVVSSEFPVSVQAEETVLVTLESGFVAEVRSLSSV